MALDWVEVNTPSIHGITRYRCGLYLLIETRPDVWRGVKMGLWESAFDLTKAQAMEECEIHYMTARLQGSTYRPHNRNREAAAIGEVWHKRGKISIPTRTLEARVKDAEDTEDQDTSGEAL